MSMDTTLDASVGTSVLISPKCTCTQCRPGRRAASISVGRKRLIATDQDPIVSGRHLRTTLRKARGDAKLTQSDVGKLLRWSVKKVYRLETGESPVSAKDAEALAGLYGLDPNRTQQLLELAEAATGPAWWAAYRRIVPADFGLYLSCERAAERLCSFHPTLVQGLVQTEQYARAILSATSSPLNLQQHVKLRQARRDVFERPQRPQTTILLGEAALHNEVSSPQVMRDQLLSLREEATASRVELGIVPFSRSMYPAMLLGFDMAHLSETEAALYLELPPISRTTQDETILNELFGDFFAQIHSRALFGPEAAALIDSILDERARGDRADNPT